VNNIDIDGRWYSKEHKDLTRNAVKNRLNEMDKKSKAYNNIKKYSIKEYGEDNWQDGFATAVGEATANVDGDDPFTNWKHAQSSDWQGKADKKLAEANKSFNDGNVDDGIKSLALGMHAYQDATCPVHSQKGALATYGKHIIALGTGDSKYFNPKPYKYAKRVSRSVANAVFQ
jgi:hypothetical protein